LTSPDAYDGTTDEKEADRVFFMPYLHWESDVVRLHTNYIMEDVDKGSQYTDEELLKLPCNVDEKLLRKYLRNSSPLHVRRTLDQAYYYTLPSTLDRDSDQVVFRYLKSPEEINPPVLMVDQCWLWVLGGTSFPADYYFIDLPAYEERRHCSHMLPRMLD
jgi:hypothetical protein